MGRHKACPYKWLFKFVAKRPTPRHAHQAPYNFPMTIQTPVTQALDALDIPYQSFTHPGEVRTLEQAAEERGQTPEQIVRSLLFRLSAETFVMVLMAGPQQVNWKKLRRAVGQKRLTTASREEVERVTGYVPGAVAPFGLPQPLRILADSAVFEPDVVSIGSGVRGTTVILKTADLKRGLGRVEIVDLS